MLVRHLIAFGLIPTAVYSQIRGMTYVVQRAMFNTECWAESLAIDGHDKLNSVKSDAICSGKTLRTGNPLVNAEAGFPCGLKVQIKFMPMFVFGLNEIRLKDDLCTSVTANNRTVVCLIVMDTVVFKGLVTFDQLPYSNDRFNATVRVKKESYFMVRVTLLPDRRLILTDARFPQLWFDVNDVVRRLNFDEYTKEEFRKSLSDALCRMLKDFMYFYKLRLENEFLFLRVKEESLFVYEDNLTNSTGDSSEAQLGDDGNMTGDTIDDPDGANAGNDVPPGMKPDGGDSMKRIDPGPNLGDSNSMNPGNNGPSPSGTKNGASLPQNPEGTRPLGVVPINQTGTASGGSVRPVAIEPVAVPVTGGQVSDSPKVTSNVLPSNPAKASRPNPLNAPANRPRLAEDSRADSNEDQPASSDRIIIIAPTEVIKNPPVDNSVVTQSARQHGSKLSDYSAANSQRTPRASAETVSSNSVPASSKASNRTREEKVRSASLLGRSTRSATIADASTAALPERDLGEDESIDGGDVDNGAKEKGRARADPSPKSGAKVYSGYRDKNDSGQRPGRSSKSSSGESSRKKLKRR